jgi:hypothetical protein
MRDYKVINKNRYIYEIINIKKNIVFMIDFKHMINIILKKNKE